MVESSTALGIIYTGFLSSEMDVIIFVSCICGILGILLILAILGWMLERSGYLKENCRPRKQLGTNLKKENFYKNIEIPSCSNHYPLWLFEKLAKEQEAIIENAGKSFEKTVQQNNQVTIADPVHYINEMFFQALNENEEDEAMGIAYEKPTKLIKPEKNAALTVAYTEKRSDSSKTDDAEKEQIKVAIAKETKHVEEKNGKISKLIHIDKNDTPSKKNTEDDAEKRERILAISSKEFVIEKKTKLKLKQSVKYENPKIEAKAREEKRRRQLEEQEQKEAEKRRIVMFEKTFTGANMLQTSLMINNNKKIPKEKLGSTLEEDYLEEDQKDYFLY